MRTLALAVLMAIATLAAAAEPGDEQGLVAVLRSAAPAAEKEAACRRLKLVGSARAVPALAALLGDERLSEWARDALESMPFPEAGEALRAALGKTRGRQRAGIVGSLGVRRERKAVPQLVRLLADRDPTVAASAAAALGEVGGPEAVGALKAAPARVGAAATDALLRCAERLLAAGDPVAAAAIYRTLWTPKEPVHIRAAAYRGLVLTSGKDALRRVQQALVARDPAAHTVALGFVRDMKGPHATRTFAAMVPKVAPAVRVPLLEALAQRGDVAAVGAIVAVAGSGDAAVRAAAVRVLGELGSASHLPLLAKLAAGPAGPVREAAQQSLVLLGRGDVRGGMLKLLAQSAPAVQRELVRALAARGERPAVPALLDAAGGADEGVATAALQALAQLADDTQVDGLLRLLAQAKGDAVREEAEVTLVAVGTRSARPAEVSAGLLGALPAAADPVRCSLLRVAGQVGGPRVLGALRSAVKDGSEEVRDAAIRTLADYAGLEAIEDLLGLARDAATPGQRALALRGYWRLVELTADRPPEERLRMCEVGMAAASRPEDRRAGLAAIGKVHHLGALKLAQDACGDAATRDEAELACVQIATRLLATNRAEAEAALRKLAADAAGQQARTDAKAAVDALAKYADFVMPWLAAGPYRQEGKECQQLYDIVFPPETGGAAEWRPAPSPPDPLLFWQVDLASVVQGNHAIAYIKTRVCSPKEQAVSFEIGNDDGVKLWVNGELAHANNAVRGLAPGQDRAQAGLKEGWNDFFAKITQHTLGCGLCLRITAPDGAPLQGLRFDPNGGN